MSENKHDALEQFFRDRLQDESPTEGDWNVPSPRMFENAMDQINDDQDDRRKIIFFRLLVGLLLVSMSGLAFYINDRLDKIDERIDTIDFPAASTLSPRDGAETLNTNTTSSLIQEDKTETGNQEVIETEEIIQTEVKNVSASSVGSALDKKQTNNGNLSSVNEVNLSTGNGNDKNVINSPTSTSQFSGTFIEDNNTEPEPRLIVDQSSVNTLLISDENLQKEILLLSKVGKIDLDLFSIDNRAKKEMYLGFDSKEVINKLGFHPRVFLTLGGNISTMVMENVSSNSFSLTEYDKYYPGIELGLGINYPISKRLEISHAVSYNTINNHSYFEEVLQYDPTKETMTAFGLTYSTDLNMETPMGGYSNTANFSLANLDLTKVDEMEHTTVIDQNIQVLGLKTGLDFVAIQNGNYKLTVGAGLGLNYILGLDNQMATKLNHEGNTLLETKKNTDEMPKINRYFASAYTGIGLERIFSDQLSLKLWTGAERSVSSLRTKTVSTAPSTYILSYKVNINLAYRF